jgi:hypothetical protein
MIPLQWGQDEKLIKKLDSAIICQQGVVYLRGASLKNFPGDCGALILTGANTISKDTLRTLCKVASNGGFSKIFATVVAQNTTYWDVQDQLATFRANKFIKVKHGKSNRNPKKEDVVFVKYISNCKYKGY